MAKSTPTAVNAVYYAQPVAEKARYRQLVETVNEMTKAIDHGGDVDSQVAEIQRLAMGLECQATQKNVFAVGEHASQVALDTQNDSKATPTGFHGVDQILVGMASGDLIVPAGRPSMGKTAFAGGIALNVARAGKRVLIFTLEMSARSLMERLIAMQAGVSLATVKSGHPPQETLDAFYQGSLDLEKLPIVIVENAITPERQAGVVQSLQQANGVDVVVVDYLGLMNSGKRTSNRNDEITAISKALKHMAQRYSVPVIALSQLNRACEGRDNHRPRLSDLRDSGSIEQDADAVLFIHREDYYRQLKDPLTKEFDGTAEIIIAKQRNGPTGIAKLVFLDEQIRFVDYVGGVLA